MQDKLVDLEYELEETRQRIHEAEEDGAEITFRYEELVAAKDAEIARLRQGQSQNINEDGECEDCNGLRFKLMVASTLFIWVFWFAFVLQSTTLDVVVKKVFFFYMFWPFADWWCARRWRRFKRRKHWTGPLDNDVYRDLQAQWNALLDLFRLG